MTSKLRLVEFCSGTGAFSYAFEKTNKVETIFANDFDKNSENIFNHNFSLKLTLKDIHELDTIRDIPEHDIMTAGFPCQPFSIAGKKQGFEDVRSNVFWKLIEIINYHKPRFVILENVKNILTHDKKNTFKTIEDEIKKLKYYYKYKVLNTCNISNIPHNRERIYIICFKFKTDYEKFVFPENISEDEKVELKNFMEKNVLEKYYYKNSLKIWDKINSEIIKKIDTNTMYQYRRYYVRENKKGQCPTLTANMGTGGHNVPLLRDDKGIRKLTPRECFNLQGFPDTYILPKLSDSSLYKLAGNAISIPVIEKIVDNLLK
jgi:DNA (cytosine-5)-methyltransferase 1